CQQESNWRTF
nr:immunoglobulin light chain junction region [Macaca mulatta]MPN94562.1 immunoglobulin light chain junction region [Macaca mulatta]MPN94616.1 immunoglobulin light chain junction region [Macaca mulatta]MPN95416.1 immunoglobulin light chain junction region [Macaca mulatta]MPN98780.1 immunoglobulin light chain junction region [Macaca mulatta]